MAMILRTCGGVTAFCLLMLASDAAELTWPQFRGPQGAGLLAGSQPPVTWSDKENVRWKVELPGAGSSSPIVANGRIFVTCFTGKNQTLSEVAERSLVCVDLAEGRIVWQKASSVTGKEDRYEGFLREHGFASNSPVTDGERVYAFYGKGGVLAYDWQGEPLWQVDVGQDSSNRRWGSAASLLLSGNAVIVNASEESRSIRSLDKLTGKEFWKSEAESLELSYSTPTLVMTADGREDLVVAIAGEVWGLNPETGKLRWYVQTEISGNVSPTPVVSRDIIYVTGGRPAATHAIRVGGKGDMTATNKLWTSRTGSYVATPVLHDGHLYFIDDRGQAFCMQAADGTVVYRERVEGLGGGGGRPVYASPVLADGKLYIPSRYDGTFVIAASPEFKILARNTLGDDSEFNATPAIVGNELLLRSDKALYCIGKSSP
ncbi:PQQ-binding-like beta-propeller repeat protein [bacterium]|nr:PQQ-binding-like beta-propeller repeat protein [bacterium]